MFPDCRENVRLALLEDIGTGDVTTQFTIAPDKRSIDFERALLRRIFYCRRDEYHQLMAIFPKAD